MIKQIFYGVAGLGTVGGIGSAIVVPIVNSSFSSSTSNTLPVVQEEKHDPNYLGKAVNYKMSYTFNRSTVSYYLQCSAQSNKYAFFRFFEEAGKNKRSEIVCEYWDTMKDIKESKAELEDNKVTVTCNSAEDYLEGKHYHCNITSDKYINLGANVNEKKVTLTWH
nr:hypothetical protein [Candidatus Mycoplasma haematolamae]